MSAAAIRDSAPNRHLLSRLVRAGLLTALGPRPPRLSVRAAQSRIAVRPFHLDGDAAGRYPDTRAPFAHDRHPLVDPIDWAHPVRRHAYRRVERQRIFSSEGPG